MQAEVGYFAFFLRFLFFGRPIFTILGLELVEPLLLNACLSYLFFDL